MKHLVIYSEANKEILSVAPWGGAANIALAEGSNCIIAEPQELFEILGDQSVNIYPLYEAGLIDKSGAQPYIEQNISNDPNDATISRKVIVRRTCIRFETPIFEFVCEVQHYNKNGEHLGEENDDILEADQIPDKWTDFRATNDIILESGIGEFDYYWQAARSMPFDELVKRSIRNLDNEGRFN